MTQQQSEYPLDYGKTTGQNPADEPLAAAAVKCLRRNSPPTLGLKPKGFRLFQSIPDAHRGCAGCFFRRPDGRLAWPTGGGVCDFPAVRRAPNARDDSLLLIRAFDLLHIEGENV